MKLNKIIMPFKREIWEYRSAFFGLFMVMGGLIVAGVFFGFWQMSGVADLDVQVTTSNNFSFSFGDEGEDFTDNKVNIGLTNLVSGMLMFFIFSSLIITIYYLVNTLYDDRKDRSILFWKSLPVSEVQVVITKALTGIFVVPLIALGIGFAVALIVALIVCLWLPLISGYGGLELLAQIRFFYGLTEALILIVTSGIWLAPFAAWCMFASALSKRSPILWLVAPPLAIMLTEKLVFNSHNFLSMLGAYMPDLANDPSGSLSRVSDAGAVFLVGPQLAVGFAIALGLWAVTIWLRNNRYEI